MADGATSAGYLGVTRSLTGRMWRTRPADPEVVRRHQLGLGLSEPLARAQWNSMRRLANDVSRTAQVYPTHGFGSFCSATARSETSRRSTQAST